MAFALPRRGFSSWLFRSEEEITGMRGRRSIAGLIALWMLASGCGNQVTPTQPSQTAEISAGGLNASGSGAAVLSRSRSLRTGRAAVL